jgi:GT2 family glycosyltransferase
MKNFPKVFIIVLNYNGRETIKTCLASVFKIEYPDFEVVVVDNNSTDGSLEEAKSGFSKAHFIKNAENLGFSAGNNLGIRFALERMAEFVLVLNNDVEVEKDFLKKLINAAEIQPAAGIFSPVIFKKENRCIWFSGGKIDWLRMKTWHETTPKNQEIYETGYLTGCAMLIRAEVFRKVGLFDEDFFLYWEDADFSWRVEKAGYKKIMVSTSWIYHAERSEENSPHKIYWLVFSGLLFFQKNAPVWLRPWLSFYVLGRRIKNSFSFWRGKNQNAKIVKLAWRDFNQAKHTF